MPETAGQLVDKLITVNVKLYHVQELLHSAATNGEGLDAETVQKLTLLNLDRNRLVREIDESLDEAVRDGRAQVAANVKLV